MTKGKNKLFEKAGWLTPEEAAERMGVTLGFFRVHVSKDIGKRIGKYKYYTEADLERWLKNQMVANV
jgi:hypothetical protein